MVDTRDLKSLGASHAGSIPALPTIGETMKLTYDDIETLRDTLVFKLPIDPEEANILCDMAARSLDLEYEMGEEDE